MSLLDTTSDKVSRAKRITNASIQEIRLKVRGLRQLEKIFEDLVRAIYHEREAVNQANSSSFDDALIAAKARLYGGFDK